MAGRGARGSGSASDRPNDVHVPGPNNNVPSLQLDARLLDFSDADMWDEDLGAVCPLWLQIESLRRGTQGR